MYRITLADGTRAVYKPTAETTLKKRTFKAGWAYDVSIPEAVREAGMRALSEAAGFSVVPRVELGDYGHGDGHAMAWVEGKVAGDLARGDLDRDLGQGHSDLHCIAALDLITGNGDRHERNFMRGEDGRYYAIDNGLAFPNVVIGRPGGLAKKVAGKRIPDEVAEGVKRLQPERVRERMLAAGLGEGEVRAATKRLAVVLGAAEKGWWPAWGDMRHRFARLAMADQ